MSTAFVLCQLVALSFSGTAFGFLEDDRRAILGTWRGGMPGDREVFELVITPTQIAGRNLTTGQSLGVGTYALDPQSKTIDTQGLENPVKGRTYLGRYQLEGNRLRWCSNNGGKKRPRDLSHNPQAAQFLMNLERTK